jgi:hypothetical protein
LVLGFHPPCVDLHLCQSKQAASALKADGPAMPALAYIKKVYEYY